MGIIGKAAKAAAKGAVKKVQKASKHYCPNTENHRHKMVKWRTEESSHTGREHGPDGHTVMHCNECGWVKK